MEFTQLDILKAISLFTFFKSILIENYADIMKFTNEDSEPVKDIDYLIDKFLKAYFKLKGKEVDK